MKEHVECSCEILQDLAKIALSFSTKSCSVGTLLIAISELQMLGCGLRVILPSFSWVCVGSKKHKAQSKALSFVASLTISKKLLSMRPITS